MKIKQEKHDGIFVGASAFFDESQNKFGISALYELDLIHPTERWSYVVSGPITYVNIDRMVHDMFLAYKNIGRKVVLMCNWNDGQPQLCQRIFKGESAKNYQFNPMNTWPTNRRHHDIQIFTNTYFPSYNDGKVVVMTPTEVGIKIANEEIFPRIKANWNPKFRWHSPNKQK